MASVRVVPNLPGIEGLLNDPGVTAELMRLGGNVQARARATAPIDTGEYAASIAVTSDQSPGRGGTLSRTVVRIGSDVRHAIVVEARSGTLGRALDAAGS